MKSFVAEVTESARLYGGTHVLWAQSPDHFASATPGQFVMTFAGDSYDPFVGRPLWIHRHRNGAAGREFAVLFDVVGRGTRWLSERREGDSVRFVGPLGRGFEPRPRIPKMLLIAEGIDVAPLVGLADALVAEGREVTLVLGAPSDAGVFPASLLPPEVELVVTTEDGSLGESGSVVPAFERLLPWSDQVFASASPMTLEAMHRLTRSTGTNKPVQALLQAYMACGTGLCDSCTVFPRRGGVRLVCTDGPTFDLRDVYG